MKFVDTATFLPAIIMGVTSIVLNFILGFLPLPQPAGILIKIVITIIIFIVILSLLKHKDDKKD